MEQTCEPHGCQQSGKNSERQKTKWYPKYRLEEQATCLSRMSEEEEQEDVYQNTRLITFVQIMVRDERLQIDDQLCLGCNQDGE